MSQLSAGKERRRDDRRAANRSRSVAYIALAELAVLQRLKALNVGANGVVVAADLFGEAKRTLGARDADFAAAFEKLVQESALIAEEDAGEWFFRLTPAGHGRLEDISLKRMDFLRFCSMAWPWSREKQLRRRARSR